MSSIDLEFSDINESNHEAYGLKALFIPASSVGTPTSTYALFGGRLNIIRYLAEVYCTAYGKTDEDMMNEYLEYIID